MEDLKNKKSVTGEARDNSDMLLEEKLEIKRLELEIKKLELEKLEKEKLKREELEQVRNKGLSIENQELIKPEPIPKENHGEIKKDSRTETNKIQEIKTTIAKSYDSNITPKKRKIRIWCTILAIVIFIYMVAKNTSDANYYSSIEPVLNPEDYYMLTYQDIYDMYGDTPEQLDGRVGYDVGDYYLSFYYKHGYVESITYIPKQGFKYRRSPKDALYVFGLGDEVGRFGKDSHTEGLYRARNDYYITDVILDEASSEKKTLKSATIFFKENYPKREVFEGDFTNVQVIYNLISLVGEDKNYVIDSLGTDMEIKDHNTWFYYTELGAIEIFFRFNGAELVDTVYFYADEPIQYETSSQEAMVMFGANPTYKGWYLDDYYYYDKDGNGDDYDDKYYSGSRRYIRSEDYKVSTGIVEDFEIVGLDIENKTFAGVTIRARR